MTDVTGEKKMGWGKTVKREYSPVKKLDKKGGKCSTFVPLEGYRTPRVTPKR